MDVKNLVMAIIGLSLGAVMIAGALLPSVAGALVVSGDSIELEQTGSMTPYPMGIVPDDETLTIDVGDGVISINGEQFVLKSSPATWSPIVYTDNGYLQVRNETAATKLAVFYSDNTVADTSFSAGDRVTFNNGICTMTVSSVTSTFNYTICYSVGYENDARLLVDMGTRYDTKSIVSSIDDIQIYGWYATGENDTQYSFKDGELSVVGDYESSVDYELTLHEGTTDIYDITEFNIIIGGESFVPYFALVPSVIEGHTDSGPSYALIGAIPLIAVAGLVMAGIYVFISRK